MIKNNKGVTLVELLIVIVILGIIAAISIPAVGGIVENSRRDAILADAVNIRNAANLYCVTETCDGDRVLTSTQLSSYIDIDAEGFAVLIIGGVVTRVALEVERGNTTYYYSGNPLATDASRDDLVTTEPADWPDWGTDVIVPASPDSGEVLFPIAT